MSPVAGQHAPRFGCNCSLHNWLLGSSTWRSMLPPKRQLCGQLVTLPRAHPYCAHPDNLASTPHVVGGTPAPPTPLTHPLILCPSCSEITGGVDQTLPRLLQLLKPHLEVPPLQPLRAQAGA